MVADDEALTKIVAAKGASAILPCRSCKNVLSAGRACGISGYFVTVACPDVSRFDCCSNEDFFDRMAAVNNARTDWENGIATKKHYESLEKPMACKAICTDSWQPQMCDAMCGRRTSSHTMFNTFVFAVE